MSAGATLVPPVSESALRVRVNGKEEPLGQPAVSIADYLASKNVRPETVAVEINLNIISKADYSRVMIRAGDEVEIVRFVGGGAA